MRGQKHIAIAVWRPDNKLDVICQPLATLYKGRPRETPLIRGIIVLIETMTLGIQALLHSAQVSSTEDEEEISSSLLWLSAIAGLVLGVAIFFIAPLLLTHYLIDPYIASTVLSNVIEGVIRIALFLAYLKLITLMPDIITTFAYHGAEHKVVNAYEAGEPLELEPVKKYSTAHARCGTSFLLAVLVIAIIVFALLGRPALWLSILSRIILIPVIAAISYELIRFSAAHTENALVHSLMAPGLTLQSMTTREPNDRQLEAALAALKKVIEADNSDKKCTTELIEDC